MCPPKLLALLQQTPFLEQASDRTSGTPVNEPKATPSRSLNFAHIVDLTHTLSPESPVFPALPVFTVEKPFATHEANGVSINRYTTSDHCGTHLDAPYHVSAKGLHTDEIPLQALVAPIAVINIGERAKHDHAARVTPDDLLAWEKVHGRLPNGAAVFMASGWAARIGSSAAYVNMDNSGVAQFPGFSVEAAQFLITERDIVGIGVDTLSLDHGPSANFAVHMAFLPSNRWGIECLANLENIPPSGALLVIGVPKIKGSSGGPARAMAMW
jgi:kynurenine formamidase